MKEHSHGEHRDGFRKEIIPAREESLFVRRK